MSKKSQAAKNGGEADLTTVSAPENTMDTFEQKAPLLERLQGTGPSLKKSQSSSKKKVKKFSVRRSERIQNSCTPRNHKIQHVIEEITLSESDEEDELPADHLKILPPTNQEKVFPELMVREDKLEGKIDYIVQLLETQSHTVNSIKTEVTRKSLSMETTPGPDVKYKSMYIASQKKIEELVEENRKLTGKLENTLDQFEAYKKGNRDGFEVLDKLKDVILASSISKVSEATQVVNDVEIDKVVVSPDAGDVPSAKRKKMTKRN